jgi:hypothetical protein
MPLKAGKVAFLSHSRRPQRSTESNVSERCKDVKPWSYCMTNAVLLEGRMKKASIGFTREYPEL